MLGLTSKFLSHTDLPAHVAALVLGVGVEDVERGVAVLVRDPHPAPGHQLLVIAIPRIWKIIIKENN